jgi:predicted Zn-dependent peptidase
MFCGKESEIRRGKRVNRMHIGIESTTLANALRVVIAPDTTAPVVTVGIYYKIGFRLEPQGRS